MAVTRIWPIKSGQLGTVIDYVANTSKTDEKNFSEEQLRDLYNALHYVEDENKTFDPNEKKLFVTGINCIPENAKQEMTDTKKRFGKEGGILAHHAYQSFKPDEVTPELAHKIGIETAKRLWGDDFEVIVATHMGSHCIHNHILLNSVSFVGGKKYNGCKENYKKFRDVSDDLCREYELSVIENPKGKRVPYNLYKAQQNGEPTKYEKIKNDIDHTISVSTNVKHFEKVMRMLGYEFRHGYKYDYIFHAMIPKGVRLINFGDDYTLEAICRRIQNKREFVRLQTSPQDDVAALFEKPPWEYRNTQKLYVNFITIVGHVRERPHNNYVLFRSLWEEELIFDQRVEEQNLMLDNDLLTDADIAGFKTEKETELKECDDARRILRNALRRAERAGNQDEIVKLRSDISSVSAAMDKLRKQIKICDRILDGAPEIEKRMKYIKERTEDRRRENRRKGGRVK